MDEATNQFPRHACQHCGSERKLLETLIDDEHVWNAAVQQYEPNRFTKYFDYTGKARCASARKIGRDYRSGTRSRIGRIH